MGIFSSTVDKLTPPSSRKFFAMLKESADAAHQAAVILMEAVTKGTLGTHEFTAEIHMHERKVDGITDRIMHSVRQTMIHPVDPDDLRNMAYSIDSTVDTMDHFAWRMEAFRLKPTPSMQRIIEAILEMTNELSLLFTALLAENYAEVQAKYCRLAALEHGVDEMFHAAIAALHTNGERQITTEHEVLSILERCSDQCRHVARAVTIMLERNA